MIPFWLATAGLFAVAGVMFWFLVTSRKMDADSIAQLESDLESLQDLNATLHKRVSTTTKRATQTPNTFVELKCGITLPADQIYPDESNLAVTRLGVTRLVAFSEVVRVTPKLVEGKPDSLEHQILVETLATVEGDIRKVYYSKGADVLSDATRQRIFLGFGPGREDDAIATALHAVGVKLIKAED